MREVLFNQTTGNTKFQAEVLDLRVDIMTGLLIPMLALGWAGMGYGLGIAPTRPDWITTGVFAVVLVLSMACFALSWSGRRRAALLLCASGTWLTATAHYLHTPDGFGLMWVGAACVLVALLVGALAGWIAVVANGAGFVWLSNLSASGFTADPLIHALAPLAVLMLITSVLSRVLFQTLRWMSEGYTLAHQQTDQLRGQSAELSSALKSLGQTSFALARANEQLEIMVKYAEDARRSKQEFAANISHELRTPLNLIIGFSDVILNSPGTYNIRRLPPGLLADIHVINQNAQHLLKLVNDILDLSQMDVAYMTIAREPVQIDGFIRSALHDFAQLIESRGLALSLDIAPGLPEIYADKTRIRQVLLNLVNNAVRFTDRGSIVIRAREDLSSSIVISVADTGVGIAPGDLQRIFEPFTKIERPNRQQGGTGLGLTISKRFVELHGGRMWVESEFGAGSVFHFALPINPPPLDSPTQGTLRAVHRHEIGVLAVVEPSPFLSRLLDRRLEGIKVVHAPSIAALRDLARDALPEAILVNVPAPELPGASELSAQFPDIPILGCHLPDLLSLPSPLVLAGGDAAGDPSAIRRHLLKPIVRERLYDVLAEMLAAAPPPARTNGDGSLPARVLIVEDDEDALHLLGRLLRSAPHSARGGYDSIIPVELRSGEQAIEYVKTAIQPAAIAGVLLDVRLGAVNGLDVLAAIDRRPELRRIPVCIVSGQDTPGEVLVTPYVTLSRPNGLASRELTQAVAALIGIALPGLDVSVR